ncbi:recombinase family protein [Actinomadura sp. 6K520]|uniref:recombinase family protein n=1 Tax=Actinomadura sp. 6K520 TaxID=2530364 RepID=UPI001404C898|nr:recombinase family protein [Actinomadura sp. 6K520]
MAGVVDPFDGLRVAWCGRTSTDDVQDPTLSLPRQLDNSRHALPAGALIVAHFYDIESGRKNLEERGRGTAHDQFQIPIPRDGGIQDLLAEATRSDRRFDAVVCESIDRISRRTFYGTKIEHELEQAGIPLFAADEPITLTGKRATAILTRRVKQGIAEWYAIQMLEQSWDGLRTHTRQGWNVGHPPYGYLADKVPHPVPAKAAEGKTKTRLVPDPVRGPAVTQIFHWRAVDKLGYGDITDLLNADQDRYPPPMSLNPRYRDRNAWSRSGVREILRNPKYTGYMVYNRRATTSARGKVNPPSAWVWSDQPTHEPLVTRETFDAAQAIAQARQRSRRAPGPNRHRQTRHSYLLRSYIVCGLCERRMAGKTDHPRTYPAVYYYCQPDRNHKGRPDRFPDHPPTVRLREEPLLDAVHTFFADRIFGPHRRTLLEADLPVSDQRAHDDWQARRQALQKTIDDLTRRRDRLIARFDQLDEDNIDLDPETERELTRQLQIRFAELETQRRTKLAELHTQDAEPPPNEHHTELLDRLPHLQAHLAELPEHLQRHLYDAFHLQIRYHPNEHAITIRITISDDTVETLAHASQTILAPALNESRDPQPPVTISPTNTASRTRSTQSPAMAQSSRLGVEVQIRF